MDFCIGYRQRSFWDFQEFVYQPSVANSQSLAHQVENIRVLEETATKIRNSPLLLKKRVRDLQFATATITSSVVDSWADVLPHHAIWQKSTPSKCEAATNLMNWQFDSPIIVQGQNPTCDRYLQQMQAVGTDIAAIVCAGCDAESEIATFDLVADAAKALDTVQTSAIVVAADRVLDAGLEAIASGIEQLVILTPNVPPLSTIKLLQAARDNEVLVLGAGSSGLIKPQQASCGLLDPLYFRPGKVGIVGYSYIPIYEVAWVLNQGQIGQSLAVSLGKDKIIGSKARHWLQWLQEDSSTEAIVLIQLAQDLDLEALEYVAESVSKPVICYVMGSKAPLDKVFRRGTDILKNHLSQAIPAASSYRKAIANIQRYGLSIATKPSQIPPLLLEENNVLVG